MKRGESGGEEVALGYLAAREGVEVVQKREELPLLGRFHRKASVAGPLGLEELCDFLEVEEGGRRVRTLAEEAFEVGIATRVEVALPVAEDVGPGVGGEVVLLENADELGLFDILPRSHDGLEVPLLVGMEVGLLPPFLQPDDVVERR